MTQPVRHEPSHRFTWVTWLLCSVGAVAAWFCLLYPPYPRDLRDVAVDAITLIPLAIYIYVACRILAKLVDSNLSARMLRVWALLITLTIGAAAFGDAFFIRGLLRRTL